MTDSRARLRHRFLAKQRWQDAEIQPLKPDASFRHYFRLRRKPVAVAVAAADTANNTATASAILMDAPPPLENTAAFVTVTEHLTKLGARAPAIYAHDREHGLLLLEDLGDRTFSRLLDRGHHPAALYRHAIGALSRIHQHPAATNIALPAYDARVANAEADLLLDWYLRAATGRAVNAAARAQFHQVWASLLAQLPPLPAVLVLRDYHVDNLVLCDGNGDPHRACALLDYQDAVIGSPAYDLVSLLADARRDLAPSLVADMLRLYHRQNRALNPHALRHHRLVWGAHRHCKVAGIFVRLWLRDGKDTYLRHLPRVIKLLRRDLYAAELQPLRSWFEDHLGKLDDAEFCAPAERLARGDKGV